MVQITVDLVRKKAEHHEKQLAPLEEIALHQENIEKIEFLQDWCPKLKILLMQSNLIARIENLNKLKHLTYLNLALNNIEIIENLERCESLQKLDLTLNFIGEIVSLESLVDNYNLENLYLTGNPCTDYENYRDFTIGTLPQLSNLDGLDIERSDRIKALQNLKIIRSDILFEQENYRHQRKKQKSRLERDISDKWENEYKDMDPDERNKIFWAEKCEHAPEVRHEIEKMRQLKLKTYETEEKKEEKRQYKFFAADGRPYNINQSKINFLFDNSDPSCFTLDLAVYKHLDTSLVDVDVQPNYVRVTIKGKIFQLHLPEEVNTTNSTAQRSQTSGRLTITMPKANPIIKKPVTTTGAVKIKESQLYTEHKVEDCHSDQSKREFLEIGSSKPTLDFTKMTKLESKPDFIDPRMKLGVKEPSPGFVDNPDVPDLI
ncbi:Leucine-rich repeat-containing protein 6 [Operophtera brumata]|uniref:Leucine-rich repeat-containing protein 6 n=1 Tax=Operophtera brumata TaxID=104452 RepID=A0A0L7KSG8_OPEBR|nr:Leucine-rich repeat-containing protein 6 [Operophtera brumata]